MLSSPGNDCTVGGVLYDDLVSGGRQIPPLDSQNSITQKLPRSPSEFAVSSPIPNKRLARSVSCPGSVTQASVLHHRGPGRSGNCGCSAFSKSVPDGRSAACASCHTCGKPLSRSTSRTLDRKLGP